MSVPTSNAGSDWCVVGGGVMGLTTALRLAQEGQRVTLLEAAPEIGGLAGAWSIGDAVWDRHYHVTLLSDLRTRALLREVGLEDEVTWRQTRTGFYTDGRLHSLSSSWEFLRFPPLSLVGKVRLGATILAASRKTSLEELEQTPVEQWLRRWSGDHTTDKVWLPLLRAKLGDAYRRTSAAFIVATIHRMYAARRSGMKREMFGYVRGGYARVMKRLAERLTELGVDVRTGCALSEVQADAGRGFRVDAQGYQATHDRVVLTVPSPVVAKVAAAMPPAERESHAQREYIGVACASVLLDAPLADFYVTNITDAGLPYTAVIEMTALVDPAELGGRRLVYLPRYTLADDPVWDEPEESVQDRFLQGLERMYPGFDRSQVLAFRLSRARHVLPVPELGYSDHLPPVRSATPGLYCLNSVRIVGGTLNVNETVQLAEQTVREVLLPDAAGARAAGEEAIGV